MVGGSTWQLKWWGGLTDDRMGGALDASRRLTATVALTVRSAISRRVVGLGNHTGTSLGVAGCVFVWVSMSA